MLRDNIDKPDVNYASGNVDLETTNININLKEGEEYLKVNWNDGEELSLSNEQLDLNIEEFTNLKSRISKGDHLNKNIKWSEQSILGGSIGNDIFISRDKSSLNIKDSVNRFLSSEGSDIYYGSESLDKLSYFVPNLDGLSGVFLSNDINEVKKKTGDLPPLILEEYEADNLLVYKDMLYREDKSIDVDLLKNIDIVKLTSNKDSAFLRGLDNTRIIDFGNDIDNLTLISSKEELNIARFSNLENLIWYDSDKIKGQIFEEDQYKVEMQIKEGDEDDTTLFTFYDYITEGKESEYKNWSLEAPYIEGIPESQDISNWTNLIKLRPNADLVGENHLVISYEIIKDNLDSNNAWLEIYVKDKRETGEGVLGLELNIDWDANDFQLNNDLFNKEMIFDSVRLPIFQKLGDQITDDSIELNNLENQKLIRALKGISAASLPNAGMGKALGKSTKSDNIFCKNTNNS